MLKFTDPSSYSGKHGEYNPKSYNDVPFDYETYCDFPINGSYGGQKKYLDEILSRDFSTEEEKIQFQQKLLIGYVKSCDVKRSKEFAEALFENICLDKKVKKNSIVALIKHLFSDDRETCLWLAVLLEEFEYAKEVVEALSEKQCKNILTKKVKLPITAKEKTAILTDAQSQEVTLLQCCLLLGINHDSFYHKKEKNEKRKNLLLAIKSKMSSEIFLEQINADFKHYILNSNGRWRFEQYGITHDLVKVNHEELLEALLANGADVTKNVDIPLWVTFYNWYPDKSGQLYYDILHLAVYHKKSCLKVILPFITDYDFLVKEYEYKTPNGKNTEIDVHLTNVTLLHLAVLCEFNMGIELLLEREWQLVNKVKDLDRTKQLSKHLGFIFAKDSEKKTALDRANTLELISPFLHHLFSLPMYLHHNENDAREEIFDRLFNDNDAIISKMATLIGEHERSPEQFFSDYRLEEFKKKQEKWHELINLLVDNFFKWILNPDFSIRYLNNKQENNLLLLHLFLYPYVNKTNQLLFEKTLATVRKKIAKPSPNELINRNLFESTEPEFQQTTLFHHPHATLTYSPKHASQKTVVTIPFQDVHATLKKHHDVAREKITNGNIVVCAFTFIMSISTIAGEFREKFTILLSGDKYSVSCDAENNQFLLSAGKRILASKNKKAASGFFNEYEKARTTISENDSGVRGNDANLHYMHSEPALGVFLTNKANIEKIVEALVKEYENFLDSDGDVKVMGLVFDVHSTRKLCDKQCVPTLYGLMRDHNDKNGFLYQLQVALNVEGFKLPKRIITANYLKPERIRTAMRVSYSENGRNSQKISTNFSAEHLEMNHSTHREKIITFEMPKANNTAEALELPSTGEKPFTFFFSGSKKYEKDLAEVFDVPTEPPPKKAKSK